MTDLYDEFSSDGWGFLLLDAVNAFNLMSRVTALWNARILWPRCSRFLFNTYRGFVVLLLRNSEEFLYSREGVTQGDRPVGWSGDGGVRESNKVELIKSGGGSRRGHSRLSPS